MRVRVTQTITIAAATASWGVVSGFGLFTKLWLEKGDHSLRAVVAKLGVALFLAVVVAAFLDWLKEHLADEATRPRAWSVSRVLTSVVILATFEFVAVALDSVLETWWEREHEVAALAAVVTSPEGEQWAFIAPDDIPDAREIRGALFNPGASPAVRRVLELMPDPLRNQLRAEYQRDLTIAARADAWSEWWRGRLPASASLAARSLLGDLSPAPEFPPIRSRDQVTEGRRTLTQALNEVLLFPDLFSESMVRGSVKDVPKLTEILLAHADPHLPARTLVRLNRQVLGGVLPRGLSVVPDPVTLPAWLDLIGLIGLWGAAGALVGGVLALTVAFPAEPPTHRFIWSTAAGAVAGGAAVPCLVPIYLTVWRLVAVGWLMWTDPDKAKSLVASYHLDGPLNILSVSLLGGRWGAVLLLFALIVAVALAIGGEVRPLFVVGSGLAVLVVPVLLDWKVLLMAKSMAEVWLVPGLTLGALVPVLRRGRGLPRAWGAISLSAAAVLAVLTAVRLYQRTGADVLVVLGAGLVAGLVVTGLLLRRQWMSWEAWPVIAVSLGVIVGSEIHALHATFRDVLVEVTELTAKMSPRTEVANLSRAKPLDASDWLDLSQRATGRVTLEGGLANLWRDPAPFPEPRDRAGAIYLQEDRKLKLDQQVTGEAQHLAEFTRELEITVVASLGFWATTGLLAAWTLEEPQQESASVRTQA